MYIAQKSLQVALPNLEYPLYFGILLQHCINIYFNHSTVLDPDQQVLTGQAESLYKHLYFSDDNFDD